MSRMVAEVILQPLITGATSSLQAIATKTSPMAYTAREAGTLSIQGGTVSVVTISRGNTSIVLGLVGGLIPMATGDKVTITFVTAPTITFIPR